MSSSYATSVPAGERVESVMLRSVDGSTEEVVQR
jgi:hypothetical protein